MKPVVVVPYDPAWPAWFAQIRDAVWPAVAGVALAMEHVGSTAVPGLAAKAVIDIDIVIPPAPDRLALVIERLAALGYTHRGTLGIAGRDAFRAPAAAAIPHHLYVCAEGGVALRNHLTLRDHLRRHPEAVAEYAALKFALAAAHPRDMDRYIEGKTAFIVGILAKYGWAAAELGAIEAANKA